MRALSTRAEARAIDQAAIAAGTPGLLLMENAGRGAAELLLEALGERLGRPLVVGGLGQNGGDAWVLARHLAARGIRCEAWIAGDPARVAGDARVMLDALRGAGVEPRVVGEGAPPAIEATVVVDGLFGTGLDRPIEGSLAALVRALGASGAPSFALDLPSGLSADSGQVLGVALPAVLTATFGVEKRGLHQHPGVGLAGRVVPVGLGVPLAPRCRGGLLEIGDLPRLLPPRAADAHKGTAGHVVVFAGSAGRTGAALLAGMGALRAGAGLVTLAARGAARAALDAKVVELMTAEIPEALEAGVAAALRECEGKRAAVLGPGAGVDGAARAYLARLAIELPVPAVLDADALTALSDPGALRAARAPRLLTPHPGEAAALLGTSAAEVQASRYRSAEALAERSGHVVVLKGARSVIAAPDGRLAVCPAGTPALGVAGTGDVLSGCAAAVLGTVADPFDAACAAVLWHALAGERSAHGDRGLLAREVADALPATLAAAR